MAILIFSGVINEFPSDGLPPLFPILNTPQGIEPLYVVELHTMAKSLHAHTHVLFILIYLIVNVLDYLY